MAELVAVNMNKYFSCPKHHFKYLHVLIFLILIETINHYSPCVTDAETEAQRS